MSIDFIVDKEFESFIPALSADEYARLEKRLIAEGCTETLKLWPSGNGEDFLIDGHNRLRICREHNIPFTTSYVVGLATRDDVKLWMIDNQLGRRNISNFAKAEIVLKEKELIAEKAKARQFSGLKNVNPSFGEISLNDKQDISDSRYTAEILAEKAGVKTDTIKRAEKILNEATPEVIDRVRSGDMSINAAYQTVKRAKPAKYVEPEEVCETGETIDELMDDADMPSLEQIVDEQGREIENLKHRIESLTVSDLHKEIQSLNDKIDGMSMNNLTLTEKLADRESHLRWHAKRCAELRKILGVNDDRSIVSAVRKLKGL